MSELIELYFLFQSGVSVETYRTLLERFSREFDSAGEPYEYAVFTESGISVERGSRQTISEYLSAFETDVTVEVDFNGLEVSFGHAMGSWEEPITSSIPYLALRVLEENLKSETYQQLFFDVLACTAEVLSPAIGVGDREYVMESKRVTQEEVETGLPKYPYNMVLFGPQAVDTLSREFLLATPAWRVRPLETGSVLMSVNPPHSLVSESGTDFSIDSFDHLGQRVDAYAPE